MQASIDNLAEEVLDGLIEFSSYFRKVGLAKDYQAIMTLYGELLPDQKEMAKIGVDIVNHVPVGPDLPDWGKKAHKLFEKMEQLEPHAREVEKMNVYLALLKEFGAKFPYLKPIAGEKIEAYHKEEMIRKHGKATKFRRIETDPNVKIEHCADCPGRGQQQETNLKGPRSFKANKANKVKSREEMIQEERQRLLNSEEI